MLCCVIFSQAALPRSTVIMATSVSCWKMEILTPCKIETLEQIDTQFVRFDYNMSMRGTFVPNLVKIRSRGLLG